MEPNSFSTHRSVCSGLKLPAIERMALSGR